MPVKLTRKELYDLVWAKPRTEIAKQFDISDVRIGKLCREMNVPAPPPGYWANLAGSRRKKKFVKPPLTYNLGEQIEAEHAVVWASFSNFDPKNFEQAVPSPPVVPSGVEETLVRHQQRIEQAPIPRGSRGLHQIVQKLVSEDERLAKIPSPFSWDKPKYQSPEGKVLLDGLNRLLWMWTDLGFKPDSSGRRHIRMRVSCAGYGRSFDVRGVTPADADGRHSAKRGPTKFELWFDTESWERQSKKPTLTISAFNPAVLRSITRLIVEHCEKAFRESVTRQYEWKVAERKELVKKAELALEHDRQRKSAELQALLDSRQKLLHNAINGVARSDQIRSLVQVLDERIGPSSEGIPTFVHWRRWALSEAEAIDPRARSLAHLVEWVEKFRLDD